MNYNLVVIISLLISAIISFLLGYYIMSIFLEDDKLLFKVGQLILVIIFLGTFYSPIKYFLLKYMDIRIHERNDDD